MRDRARSLRRCKWAAMPLLVLTLGQGCPPPTSPPPPPPPDPGLTAENQRVAFASQCALNVITCTVSFPDAKAKVLAGPNQVVRATPRGFIVEGRDNDGSEPVQLIGSESTPGQGAGQLFFSWSHAASDTDPRTLEAGPEFSTQVNPEVRLQAGFHYIRLTLHNDLLLGQLISPQFGVIAENVPKSDFVEIEIEVRD